MFSDDFKQFRIIFKLVLSIFTACVFIYLSFRYVHILAASIRWLLKLLMPILLGILFSLILNIPLHFFEDRFLKKSFPKLSHSRRRSISIFLSLFFIFGILFLILFLVLPELSDAIIHLINIGSNSVTILSSLEKSINLSKLPFGEYLSDFNIDWNSIGIWLEDLLPTFGKKITNNLENLVLSSFDTLIDIFFGLIFSIYILSHKELFKVQVRDFLGAWLPSKWTSILYYITCVSLNSFRNFIVGQTIEAFILGSLCATGMFLLNLPFAPTIGALVGVTALIPYVGAYLGAFIGAILILTVDTLKVLFFLLFLITLQQVEGNIIYPRVVGNRIKLPSLWVLFALTLGGRLFGPVGMFLGVPAFSAIYRLLKEATEKQKKKRLTKY